MAIAYTKCFVYASVTLFGLLTVSYVITNTNVYDQLSVVKQPPVHDQPATIHVKESSMSTVTLLPVSDTVFITPEKLDQNKYISEDVYMSILTTPRHHESRFALQLLTWMQTFNLKQVRVITDKSDDKWIKSAQQMGFNIIFCGCAKTTWHNRNDIRCKTGRQFEEFYKARDNGEKYGWYCHADDDVYFNAQSLSRELSKYDPYTEHVYLGQFKGLTKAFFNNVPRYMGEKFIVPEAKKKGVIYAQGSTYCVSAAIMFGGAEKYLRGKRFVDLCTRMDAMDDVCVGAVIENLLGNAIIENTKFQSQVLALTPKMNADELKQLVSFSMGTFNHLKVKSRFTSKQDPSGYLSYHCMLHPYVSWCSTK